MEGIQVKTQKGGAIALLLGIVCNAAAVLLLLWGSQIKTEQIERQRLTIERQAQTLDELTIKQLDCLKASK